MTVNTKKITSGPYVGNDIADTFSYTFKIEDKTELKVYETDNDNKQVLLILDTDYTVNTVGVDGGGTITRVSGPLPTGFEWFIRSNFIETQLTAFGSQGPFFPDIHENAMDKLTLLLQQILDGQSRSPSVSETYTGELPLSMEDPAPGFALRWNDDGTILELYDPSTLSSDEISADKPVINYSTLLSAINDTSLKLNQACNVKGSDDNQREMWDVVLTSSVTVNNINIIQSNAVPTLSLVQRTITPRLDNLLWQGSMNVWQRGFAFDDFTLRAGVMDGWSFSRGVASDKQILIIQHTDEARLQRIVGDVSTSPCYLVANMDHEATKKIAGKDIHIKTVMRSNNISGDVKLRVQYTTYSDLQKITDFTGVYPVEHNEITNVLLNTTPASGFETFDTAVSIPSNATQVALTFIYEPSGTAPLEEFIEFKGVSITDRPFAELPSVPFADAITEAQRQYRKSYAYDSFPRTVSDFGAVSDVSIGTDTTTDSNFDVNFDVSMLYAPTITVRQPSGGGSGVYFDNETSGTDVVALVNIISSKGFRLEAAAKATPYEIGTFTPAFGSVNVNHTLQAGKYVKQGDTVYFTIELEYNTMDLTDPSNIQIVNLPFGGADDDGLGSVNVNLQASTGFAFTSLDPVYPTIFATAGTIIAFSRPSGVNYDYRDGTILASGKVVLSGTYKTSEIYGTNTYSAHYEAEARL